jgi:hypothetical protein
LDAEGKQLFYLCFHYFTSMYELHIGKELI